MKKFPSNIDQLREKHKKELEELTSNCGHKNISDWIPFHWHVNRYEHKVRTCLDCGMVVEEDKSRFDIPADTEVQEDGRCVVKMREGVLCQG